MAMSSRPIALGFLLLLIVSAVKADSPHSSPYSDPANTLEVVSPSNTEEMGQRMKALVLSNLQSVEEYIPLGTVKNIDWQINRDITFVFDGKLINSDGTWTGRSWRSLTTPEGVTIGPFQALSVFKAPDVSDLYQVKVTPLTAGTKELRFGSLNTGVAEVLINLNVLPSRVSGLADYEKGIFKSAHVGLTTDKAEVLSSLGSNEHYVELGTTKTLNCKVNTEITFLFDGNMMHGNGTWVEKNNQWEIRHFPAAVNVGPIKTKKFVRTPNSDKIWLLYSVAVTSFTAGPKAIEFANAGVKPAEFKVLLNVEEDSTKSSATSLQNGDQAKRLQNGAELESQNLDEEAPTPTEASEVEEKTSEKGIQERTSVEQVQDLPKSDEEELQKDNSGASEQLNNNKVAPTTNEVSEVEEKTSEDV